MRTFKPRLAPRPQFDFEAYSKWRNNSCGRFVLEIGCGTGYHPILWSRSHPNDQVLALERTSEKFSKFKSRFSSHPQLTNLFPAHAEAQALLPYLLEPKTVDIIFILYPNPYPKKKHKNQRFAFNTFTPFLANSLKDGGCIQFATNIKSYADELVAHLPQNANLKLMHLETLAPSATPRTHFEKKYLSRGEPCYDLTFTSTAKI